MHWGWFRCWIHSNASSMFNEPPYAEPHVRWCERATGVTPSPTRSVKYRMLSASLQRQRQEQQPEQVQEQLQQQEQKLEQQELQQQEPEQVQQLERVLLPERVLQLERQQVFRHKRSRQKQIKQR